MTDIDKLLNLIDRSVTKFSEGLDPIQQEVYKNVVNLTKQLDLYSDGSIKNNLNNIKLIGKLKGELDNIVLSDDYLSHVKEFIDAYDGVKKLQNAYFASLNVSFKEKKVFEEVKKVAIDNTIEGLTESGIASSYTGAIKEILNTNITSGGSYADLTQQLSNFVLGDKENEGALVKYGKQITTDSINQFSAQYTKVVSDDLGLSWYQYVGSLITTSRPFCKAMTDKRYFHVSEIPELLNGHVGDKTVPLNKKTGLPSGMIEGTNAANFFVYRGGYSCGHQIFPVALAAVPKELRDRFKQ